MRWAIFCRVIDNYGDAGVCWRLAVDLAERGEEVILIIDHPEVLDQLRDPDHVPTHITIQPWPAAQDVFTSQDVADVVIEAFACNLPDAYVVAMAARAAEGHDLVWINLEYLSAEDWIGAHHRMPSPHPRYPLVKYFYFPGFTPDSGGLIREASTELAIRQETDTGVPHAPLRIFLFGYQQPALETWLPVLHDTRLNVAPCPTAEQIQQAQSSASEPIATSVSVQYLSFVPQSGFDRVLAANDLLFVRGEDSFVRAQWAGKPVFWQIYPQADRVHIEKLLAFYTRYMDPAVLDDAARKTLLGFVLAWNGASDPADCARLWPEIVAIQTALLKNALKWRKSLLQQPDLVTQLRAFVADLVK